jgi:hypothetical protein
MDWEFPFERIMAFENDGAAHHHAAVARLRALNAE